MDILIADDIQVSPARQVTREELVVPCPARLAAGATSIRGVRYRDGQLVFDRAVHDEATAAVLTRRLKGERLDITFQGGGEPTEVTDEDLRIINERHSAIELGRDDVVIFQDYAANDKLTRKPIRLTKRALERFAENYAQGREVQFDHDHEKPVGATFAGKVIEDTMRGITANWLVVRWYAVLDGASELRRQRIQDMRTGVRRYTSVGLQGGDWEFQEIEGPDGDTTYFYEIDDNPGGRPRLESDHLARVSLGAVYGAGSNKAMSIAGSTGLSASSESTTHQSQEVVLCDW